MTPALPTWRTLGQPQWCCLPRTGEWTCRRRRSPVEWRVSKIGIKLVTYAEGEIDPVHRTFRSFFNTSSGGTGLQDHFTGNITQPRSRATGYSRVTAGEEEDPVVHQRQRRDTIHVQTRSLSPTGGVTLLGVTILATDTEDRCFASTP